MKRCPYCDIDIDEESIHRDWFMFKDCAAYFDFNCPECGNRLEVDVEQEPIFILHRASGGNNNV